MSSGPSAAAERVRCWSCSTVHPSDLFCPACAAIQPLPTNADHFQVLGLERRLIVDSDALERRYFDLSRRLHPDRYQNGPAPARVASLGNTAVLNRAYRALRDPIERGIYWLGLHGESLGGGNNHVPPVLAEQVFEVQEKLAEMRAGGAQVGSLAEEIRAARADLEQQRSRSMARLEENFARWDTAAADEEALLAELKETLAEISYLRTLLRDVDKELSH